MKISQITEKEILAQIRADPDYVDENEKEYLEILRKSAVRYVSEYTGLGEEEMEKYEDITIAVLVLISDMYDNRQMYVDKSNPNRTVETILGMHCVNLL